MDANNPTSQERIISQTECSAIKIDVCPIDETVWLSLNSVVA